MTRALNALDEPYRALRYYVRVVGDLERTDEPDCRFIIIVSRVPERGPTGLWHDKLTFIDSEGNFTERRIELLGLPAELLLGGHGTRTITRVREWYRDR